MMSRCATLIEALDTSAAVRDPGVTARVTIEEAVKAYLERMRAGNTADGAEGAVHAKGAT